MSCTTQGYQAEATSASLTNCVSDIGGRKWVYVASITAYAILNFVSIPKWSFRNKKEALSAAPVFPWLLDHSADMFQGTAYARNLPMLIIFMFLIGVAGSTALSNVAGTIADLFGDVDGAGQAMALFVVSANTGPSLGSPVGAWITDDPSLGLKWIFLINVIIGFGFAVIMCFIPETLPRLVIASHASQSEDLTADDVAILKSKVNVWKEMRFVATMTFRIMFTEPIVLCLGIYNGFAYGILFLYLDGVFDVFVVNNGLS